MSQSTPRPWQRLPSGVFGLYSPPHLAPRDPQLFRQESSIMARLTINGAARDIDVDPNTPLLWVLLEQAGLTGSKYGCGVAQCGACTVHIDGNPVRSCVLPVSALTAEQKITTIEGLSKDGSHPLQQAWLKLDVPQCGYCQSGMIMAAAGLLQKNPKPTDADIDAEITNICRCGTYNRVRAAIKLAVSAVAVKQST